MDGFKFVEGRRVPRGQRGAHIDHAEDIENDERWTKLYKARLAKGMTKTVAAAGATAIVFGLGRALLLIYSN